MWDEIEAAEGLPLRIAAGEKGLYEIRFAPFGAAPEGSRDPNHPLLVEAAAQLRAYFDARLREFSLPLDPQGTPFQLRVWRELVNIPYGATRTYGDIAAAIGSPDAVRAVGAANGTNPIAIVIPCHRVIGANGKLTGYAGGMETKRRLLDLELGYAWAGRSGG